MKELVSAYNLFSNRIDDISAFIQNMMSSNDTWGSFENFELSEEQQNLLNYVQSSSGKTIQYNAVIISLYGCFENYIDTVFSRYLDFVFSGVSEYDNLPKKIKEKYTSKLSEYLTAPNRFYGIDIPTVKLLDDYLKVLNSNFSETVNKTFLLMHSGNLRLEQLNTFMVEMGIQNPKSKIYSNTLMKSFHMDVLGYDEADYTLKVSRDSQDLSMYLDKLVDQRNSVAHGWVESNRISIYDFNTYLIPYMKVLAEVLLRILLCESIKFLPKEETAKKFEEKPLAVYNHNIVCLHIIGQTVSTNDYMMYVVGDNIQCAKIHCIQINKKNIERISGEECDVGIKIDTRISEADKVYLFVEH